jgi:hypothetical protein
MRRRIYVHQYGYWWSFTEHQWREWLEQNLPKMGTEGYCLPNSNGRKRKPAGVKAVDMDGDKEYYLSRAGDLILHPLDWDNEDWVGWLNDEGYQDLAGLLQPPDSQKRMEGETE